MIKLLTILCLLTTAHATTRLAAPTNHTSSFTVRFTLNIPQFPTNKTILEIPDVLTVVLRQHDSRDRARQNYPAFKMPDGSTPVLEATLRLHSQEHPDWKFMTIGFPLAMLKKPKAEHEIGLVFTGARGSMYVDGELLDNDFPFGFPRWPVNPFWSVQEEFVKNEELQFPAINIAKKSRSTKVEAIQYWTPPGHNSWVGDVATIFHKGRYHLFYLYDRRHHQSKFGQGAHYFEHLSTADFKTWTVHDAATPLEEQWECIGTGVPFVFNDKLHLSYGLHTTRVYPREKTTLPAQWDYLKRSGQSGSFPRESTPGFPAGSTYSVSADDGRTFQKSQIMFHPCENPSVYTDPNGKLRMLANFGAKGMWESESIDGGWRCVNPEFPPGGDCTFYIRWGAFDYIVGGFTGLWSKRGDAPDSAYEDIVRKGLDFYDGSNVPAISRIKEGRYIMAAWLPIRGWGGPLLIRELVQLQSGRIGSKWMNEVMPRTGKARTLARKIASPASFDAPSGSFMLSFDAIGKGKVGVEFLSEKGCELQIDSQAARAQFADSSASGFGPRQKSLREGAAPHQAGNYAIENLIDVDRPFAVRVIVKTNEKLGGSLIDVEIAGKRTMISYRPDLLVKTLRFQTQGVEARNISVAAVKE